MQGLIGGDSLLSPRGVTYSHKLASFMDSVYPRESAELVVWTSSLRRTQQTASSIGRDIVQWKALDEIDAGICDVSVSGAGLPAMGTGFSETTLSYMFTSTHPPSYPIPHHYRRA